VDLGQLAFVSRLHSLRTLAVQGLSQPGQPDIFAAPQQLCLSRSLTTLLLNGITRAGAPLSVAFGPPLLRQPRLQYLDVKAVI